MSYVLMEKGRNWWHNNGGQDYFINLEHRPTGGSRPDHPEGLLGEMVASIIEVETKSGSWTLMHRYNKCHENIIHMDRDNRDFIEYFYIWLRYSFIR